MGMEEFMVCVDRIIATSSSTSSSSSAVAATATATATGKVLVGASLVNNDNGGRENVLLIDANKTNGNGGLSFKNEQNIDGAGMVLKLQENEKGNDGESRLKGKNGNLRECRICQEEDFELDMEVPCACNGTLKFAHRKCIQRWCNKKGDITCEICNQIFSPNYILPPKKSNPDVMAIDIRQAWASNIDLRDPRFLAFAAAQHQFLQSDYEEYSIESSGAFAYFRMVVITLMVLLLVRQTLMITKDLGMLQESSTFFRLQIMLLQLAGFLLPCYVMARSVYIMQCRRRRQV